MNVISLEEIKNLIAPEELFEPVKQAFIDYSSGKVIGAPINLLHFKNNADAHIKIAAIEGYPYFTVKVATMFPKNISEGLLPNNGAIFLFSATTGELTAVLDDKGFLTDIRTAVAGAAITNVVAPKSSDTITVIGTGIQAFYQIKALKVLRDFSTLTIYGRDIEKAALLKSKIEKSIPDISIHLAKTLEASVKNSEIIITTTSSTEPLIHANWLTSGHHITAIGADDTMKKELDIACFEKADSIFVDSIELNKTYGEYKSALSQNPNIIHKTFELGQLFKDAARNYQKKNLTIAKLVGLGVQDLAAASVVIYNYVNKMRLKENNNILPSF